MLIVIEGGKGEKEKAPFGAMKDIAGLDNLREPYRTLAGVSSVVFRGYNRDGTTHRKNEGRAGYGEGLTIL